MGVDGRISFRVLSDTQLKRQRRELLDAAGMTYEQLAERHAYRDLTPEQWEIYHKVRNIDFLLGE